MKWVTVHRHKGYEIQIVNLAKPGDPQGYRTNPALPGQDHECGCLACTFSTIGDAVQAIDKYGNPSSADGKRGEDKDG